MAPPKRGHRSANWQQCGGRTPAKHRLARTFRWRSAGHFSRNVDCIETLDFIDGLRPARPVNRLLWYQRIVVNNKKVKGWDLPPSHFVGQNLVNVWLDQ